MFTAIFESVWKRKETKIFLGLALLPALLYALGSFFGGSNFNQITADKGSLSLLDFLSLLFTMIDSIVLPMIAFVYLTVTVFTRERDDHTLFLYKDLNRSKVFWAKLGSLVVIIGIFFALFLLVGILVYYTRATAYPYASGKMFGNLAAENLSNLASLLSSFVNFLFFLIVTAFLALRVKMGLTILVTIILDLVVLFTAGGENALRFLLPKAYGANWWQVDNPNVTLLFTGMVVVTLIYFLIFGFLADKSYQKMEF